ncbi:MAG: MerR family transcriptional regulator [Actinobacteria bacterium]|nr:MerR family transcriptional regulator [Actinomycetota bacterium]
MHQIGEAAGRVGLSLRTVRYYEEVGLVVPSGRTDGGFRLYTEDDIDRLALVKQLKPLEFGLDELRQLLEVRDRLVDEDDPDVRRDLVDRLDAYADTAAERCAQLREQLARVEAVAATLRRETRLAGPRDRAEASRS